MASGHKFRRGPLLFPDFSNFVSFFVHDGINSVADYNSLRVDVEWMSDVVCLSYVPQANFTMG